MSSCYTCKYLKKRPGRGSYFIFHCKAWDLTCQQILPQSIVIQSIGKKCPFFKKMMLLNNKKNIPSPPDNSADDLDIII
ncbi:MAG: hypothetical protein MJB14_00390 [Spirochaetes bacterium]|nr:hypothetical protein [Spirochaetota bacterium]